MNSLFVVVDVVTDQIMSVHETFEKAEEAIEEYEHRFAQETAQFQFPEGSDAAKRTVYAPKTKREFAIDFLPAIEVLNYILAKLLT